MSACRCRGLGWMIGGIPVEPQWVPCWCRGGPLTARARQASGHVPAAVGALTYAPRPRPGRPVGHRPSPAGKTRPAHPEV